MHTMRPCPSESATPCHSVLLVSSQHFNWVGLKATVEDWPEVQIVADVQQCEAAMQVAGRERPDFIFMASDLVDVPVVPLVRDLRIVSPASQIIVIGKLLEAEAHRQLTDMDLVGFLQWKCVTAERLRHMIAAVRAGEVRVASKAVIQVLRTSERQQQAQGADSPVLTCKERAVLLGLAKGLTQQQIAEANGVSVRTVEDRIAVLEDKFDAPTMFMLGVKAERAGFVP
jgi:DNA-binding NarL/FixJ family response regulator